MSGGEDSDAGASGGDGFEGSAGVRPRIDVASLSQNNFGVNIASLSGSVDCDHLSDWEKEQSTWLSMLTAEDITAATISGFFQVVSLYSNRASRYPIHYVVASKVYSALATECNCERLFSGAGTVMSDLRTSLSTEYFEAWTTVPANYDILVPSTAEIAQAYVVHHGAAFPLEGENAVDEDDDDCTEELPDPDMCSRQ